MPPPPRALPFENLSSGQVMLRAIVVLLVLFVIVLFGRRALHDAVCDPRNPAPLLCPDYAQAAPDEQP